MALDLVDYESKATKAVKAFWCNRVSAQQKQRENGRPDQGERAGVTAGRNMDGFLELVIDVVRANGLGNADIHRNPAMLTLPGYFWPTKRWDVLVIHKSQLIAAVELKSQVGPSFGNNFNNRVEEAIGTAHDFWTAYREQAVRQATPTVRRMVDDGRGCHSILCTREREVSTFSCVIRIQWCFISATIRPIVPAPNSGTALYESLSYCG